MTEDERREMKFHADMINTHIGNALFEMRPLFTDPYPPLDGVAAEWANEAGKRIEWALQDLEKAAQRIRQYRRIVEKLKGSGK